MPTPRAVRRVYGARRITTHVLKAPFVPPQRSELGGLHQEFEGELVDTAPLRKDVDEYIERAYSIKHLLMSFLPREHIQDFRMVQGAIGMIIGGSSASQFLSATLLR